MPFNKPADEVIFLNKKVEGRFESLQEDNWLKKAIKKVISNVKNHQSKTGGMKMPHFIWFLSTLRIPRAY